jgi:hypothetical protein
VASREERLMRSLPAWCDTLVGREIIAALRRDPPETYIRSNRLPSIYGGYPGIPEERFTGKLVNRLRRMREEWLERELAAFDAQFEVSGKWDDEASRAVFGSETADDLIRRMLAEEEQRRAA